MDAVYALDNQSKVNVINLCVEIFNLLYYNHQILFAVL